MSKRLITLVASAKNEAKWGCGLRPDDTVRAVPNVGGLKSIGCEALVARSGLEALRAAMQHHLYAIFLDGLMPDARSGGRAVIRQTDPACSPRTVMLAAFHATRNRNDAKLRHGVDGFLPSRSAVTIPLPQFLTKTAVGARGADRWREPRPRRTNFGLFNE